MKKRNVSRILRNLLVAALIVSALAVTAYAVAGFVIFDSPQDMISGLFGDRTGYDHKDVTHFTDPEKPGEVYDIPAYDRAWRRPRRCRWSAPWGRAFPGRATP